jgi:hypothetical protein
MANVRLVGMSRRVIGREKKKKKSETETNQNMVTRKETQKRASTMNSEE